MRIQERSENNSSSSTIHRKEAKPIVINRRGYINSVAVPVDGKHVVSGSDKGTIRRWGTEDGKKVGKSIDAGSAVRSIAVSQEGKVIVSGRTRSGRMSVECRKSLKK